MGINGATTLIKWFGILPNEIDVRTLLRGELENPVISEGNIDKLMPWASDIETKLGYKFNNRAFLLQVNQCFIIIQHRLFLIHCSI